MITVPQMVLAVDERSHDTRLRLASRLCAYICLVVCLPPGSVIENAFLHARY